MQAPRLSAKGWFWSLTLAAFVWAYLGTRMAGASGTSGIYSVQWVAAAPVHLVVVPGSWIVTSVQSGLSAAVRHFTVERHDTETMATLEEKNRKLQDDIAMRDERIRQLVDQIKVMKGYVSRGIEPTDVVRAYIVGRNMGSGSATINIDKGTADGVRAGYPVIAGENHIVGRVLTAYAKTSVVRLITDRRSSVYAVIVRYANGGTQPLLKSPILAEGQNNGEFTTDGIKTSDAQIEVGDIVLLHDNEWPAKLQNFILGVVSDVTLDPNQMLRYEVRNRANINDIQYVEVLTKF